MDAEHTASGETPRDVSPDPSPTPSRASASFSFHEERRMLKSDEYWLAHKLPRLPPPPHSTDSDDDGDENESHTSRSRSLIFEDADGEAAEVKDHQDTQPRSTRESAMVAGPSLDFEFDPQQNLSRPDMDADERLNLAEEESEKNILHSGTPTGMKPDFDTGESPATTV